MTGPGDLERIRERVRARYAQAAVVVTDGRVATCADSCGLAMPPSFKQFDDRRLRLKSLSS